jgi:voltage-gated potassium channel
MSPRERIRFWFDDMTTPAGRATDLVVMALILLACANAVAMTYVEEHPVLQGLDLAVTACFIVEYLLRLWAAENRVRHVFSLYAIIDLVAILPAAAFHALRIFRLLRILRLVRFLETKRFFFGTVRQVHLYVARVAFTLFAIPFVSAGLIYYAEHRDQAAGEQPFENFFDAFYYCVVTLTTVGFGDQVPTTSKGRVITLVIIASGIVFIPWQVKNLIAHFLTTREKAFRLCPSCGLEYHEVDARHCRRCGAELGSALPPDAGVS